MVKSRTIVGSWFINQSDDKPEFVAVVSKQMRTLIHTYITLHMYTLCILMCVLEAGVSQHISTSRRKYLNEHLYLLKLAHESNTCMCICVCVQPQRTR